MADDQLASDYAALLRVMEGVPTGRSLDVPCGPGILARALSAQGVRDITGVDILLDWEVPAIEGMHYVWHDIDTPPRSQIPASTWLFREKGSSTWPVRSISFGSPVECSDPGWLLLTTTAVVSEDGRVKFLRTGQLPKFRDLVNDRAGLRREEYLGHVSVIYFWPLVTFLGRYGLEVELVATDNPHVAQPIHKRLLHVLRIVAIGRARRRHGLDALGAVSVAVPFGDSLIERARKVIHT